MRKEKYKRLTNTEREEISRYLARRKQLKKIAKQLVRSPRTISGEIKRNRGRTSYRGFSTGNRARAVASSRR